MPDDTSTQPPTQEELEWLTNELAREQEYYWTRFSAFATLHAGLLVLVTSDTINRPLVLTGVSVALGVVWFYVQWASLFYVNRLKPRFHVVREARGYHYVSHPIFSRRFLSSTDVALLVPAGLTVFWLIFPCLL